MRPKVSVVVPVYKVEKYLERCVKSLLTQSLKEIEVILVDDGSPDNCGRMCDKYAVADERVKVIHKSNAGVSAARNSGLEIAQGEFVGFVDSDDYVAPTMFEEMYRQAVLSGAEMSMCHFVCTDGTEDAFTHVHSNEDYKIISLNTHDAFEVIADFSKSVQVPVWNKIYKKELIEDITFDTNKRMAEDLEFLMKALLKATQVVYVPYSLYAYYAQREGAATFHADHELKWYLEQNDNITAVMKNVAEQNPAMRKLAIGYKCVNGDLSIANAMVRSGVIDDAAAKVIKKDIIRNFVDIMGSELHMVKKVQMIVFLLSPKMYLMYMRNKLKV